MISKSLFIVMLILTVPLLSGAEGYPPLGVPYSTGSQWGPSYSVGTGKNNLIQLDSLGRLPALDGSLLFNLSADGFDFEMDYPPMGIPYSTGTAWGASLVPVPEGIVQFLSTGEPIASTDLPILTTIGEEYIYRENGMNVSVTDGGTARSSWTALSIPYASSSTSFGEIPVGKPNQVLKVLSDSSGYSWVNDYKRVVSYQIGEFYLTPLDVSGTIITNSSQQAGVWYHLPPIEAGMHFKVLLVDAIRSLFQVESHEDQNIMLIEGTTAVPVDGVRANEHFGVNTIGYELDFFALRAMGGLKWHCINRSGDWQGVFLPLPREGK